VAELRVPATKVARRAVDGVAVLLKLYAHCIDGQADAVDKRAGSLLGELKSVVGFSIGLVGRTRPDHGQPNRHHSRNRATAQSVTRPQKL
jgi:hypothetical protein